MNELCETRSDDEWGKWKESTYNAVRTHGCADELNNETIKQSLIRIYKKELLLWVDGPRISKEEIREESFMMRSTLTIDHPVWQQFI